MSWLKPRPTKIINLRRDSSGVKTPPSHFSKARWSSVFSKPARAPIFQKWRSSKELFLVVGELFQLAMPIELANDRGILAPVRLDFDHEFQEDFDAEYRFEFQASLRSDFLDGGAALADQNSLLAFALDVNSGAYTRQFLGFLEIVNQHGDGVRDLFPCNEDRFLANEFGGEETLRLVCKLIRWKMRRRLRKPSEPGIHQGKAAGAGARWDGEN